MNTIQNESHTLVTENRLERGSEALNELQKPAHFFLEAFLFALSAVSFALAAYLVIHSITQNKACLLTGCFEQATFPGLYWSTMFAFGILGLLSAYVLTTSVRKLNQ